MDKREVGMKKLFALLAVSIFLIAACGGDNTETNATLEDVEASPCLEVPVDVPSVSILGQRVKSVSDLKVCAVISAGTGIVPEVQQFDDCGNPCAAVVVNNFDIRADAKITIDYKQDGQQVPTTTFDPEPVNQKVGEGRLCLVGVGGDADTPDPCAERLTTPRALTGTPGRKQIALSWRQSVDTGNDNLLGYEVWRSMDGTTFEQLATIAETTFADSGLTRQTAYYYYVVAFDADGNRSQASNTAQVTTQ